MNEVFTQGKWEVIDGTQVGEQILFVHVEGEGIVCRLTKQEDTHIPLSKADVANAHLIAAAPEMYRAMQTFVNRVEAGEVRSSKTYQQFQDVLALAKGPNQ